MTIADVVHLVVCEDLLGVDALVVNLARLLHDDVRSYMLLGWDVFWMKGILGPNIASLVTHFLLIAVLGVRHLKVVQNLLINDDFVAEFAPLNLFSRNLQINFGAKRPEVFIEALLAAEGALRVEVVERLHVSLVAPGHNL